MARIRTIKPEFFTSEDIVSLSPLARLFYVGLWCEADREGRLDWRVGTLKMRYLPGDNCDINELASELVEAGLVVIYEVEGKQYAEIPAFTRHQVINNREAPSTRPDSSFTRASRVKAEGRKEGKGREGKEYSEANASGADAPPKPVEDMTKDELWSAGKSLLQQAGTPKAQCGSIVGKLVKDYGDQTVIEAVRSAVVERPADPVSFLKAVCQRMAGERKPAHGQSFAQQDELARRARWEQMTGRKWPEDGSPPDFIDVETLEVGYVPADQSH